MISHPAADGLASGFVSGKESGPACFLVTGLISKSSDFQPSWKLTGCNRSGEL